MAPLSHDLGFLDCRRAGQRIALTATQAGKQPGRVNYRQHSEGRSTTLQMEGNDTLYAILVSLSSNLKEK